MKLSRSDLKSIVKECLVEILTEGVGNSILESAPRKNTRVVEQRQRKFDPALDTPVATQRTKINTGNPIYDSILSDTAKTTLPTMLAAESSKTPQPTGAVERLVESSTPEELFGESASSKWAQLAFSAPQRNY